MEQQNFYQYNSKGYFSRSFSTVFSGKNFSYFLLACLIFLIPVIGPLWTIGYFMRRAEKIAWGIKCDPSREDLDFVPCIKIGFATSLMYLAAGLLMYLLGKIFSGSNLLNAIWNIVAPLLGVFLFSTVNVYALQYVIYNDVNAIFTKRPLELIKEGSDSFISMNIAIFFIELIFGVLNFILMITVFAKVGLDTLLLLDTTSIESRAMPYIQYIFANLGTIVIFILFLMTSAIAVKSLHINAVGLWLMGSDVPAWRNYRDPFVPRRLADGQVPNTEKYEHHEAHASNKSEMDVSSHTQQQTDIQQPTINDSQVCETEVVETNDVDNSTQENNKEDNNDTN